MREPSKPRLLTPTEISAVLRQKTRANAEARAAVQRRGVKLHPRIAAAKAADSSSLDEMKALVALCDPFQHPHAAKPVSPIIDAATGKVLNKPELMLSLARHDQSLSLLFDGLRAHYIESITMGRLDAWKKCGHAIIELCAEIWEAKIERRSPASNTRN